ncbi:MULTISPECIES: DUF2470 domain-containing protein [unclassified Beijerinckia]|uniref:HugZ family pyridoxamine 5'-phosphate oxidase n=1 Tax=unclassified Beijerinckia TaxID=2638183 RepID=UPI000897A78B|nr:MULTISPECIES: DUF2470 domain-containing protein [unclassified Beijerinckia]MDH7796746.1 putative heme iron utilization protein [Beijerinckia sp. GAS462]SEC58170.1 hypothetical protein SAMN05443249_3029 [Beijerinckia sp. 28-YEA-48]
MPADTVPSAEPRPTVPEGYDAIAVSKGLLRSIRAGALATLAKDGFPFSTLVNVATDYDGTPILLLSGLAIHTRNLATDARASLLLAETGKGDPLAHPRLTITGTVRKSASEAERDRLKQRFLGRHPKSQLYADFADFGFYRLEMANIHLNGGFARAADFESTALRTSLDGADSMIAAEASAIAHMNSDHTEAVRLYATKLRRAADGPWRISGIDPEGVDLAWGESTERVTFQSPVLTAEALHRTLVQLAVAARSEN